MNVKIDSDRESSQREILRRNQCHEFCFRKIRSRYDTHKAKKVMFFETWHE